MDDVGTTTKKLLAGFMLQNGSPPPPEPPSLARDGSDGNNRGMEARVAKLEAAAEFIQRDVAEIKSDQRTLAAKVDAHFLILAGMIIAAVLGLAGLMAKGFQWI